MTVDVPQLTVGVLGGTGPLGGGLARRFAAAGVRVVVGSRGDDRDATDTVRALAGVIPGVRGLYGGRLRNAAQVEAFTANLISINRR